jgi:hypothetical protein
MFLCRCDDCKKATGSPFAANVWFAASTLTFKTEPKARVVVGSSGATVRHEFCERCGSPIGMRSESYSNIRGVRVSTLDDPHAYQPVANVWVKSALDWDQPRSDLHMFDTQPSGEDIARLFLGQGA